MCPLNKALLFGAMLFVTTHASAGYLGLNVQNMPAHVRAHMPEDVTKTQGVIVNWLEDISPAADDGIQLYDVLLSYNDQAITSSTEFLAIIQQASADEKVMIKLLRQGEVLSIPITIADAPSSVEIEKMTPAPKQSRLYQPKPPAKQIQKAQNIPNPANYQRRPLNIAGKPAFPMRKKPEVHSWGKERNIWPDFYTDGTGEIWDNMMNAPFKMGRMPGGWRAPSLSMPDPVTIGDAVTNQMPPMAEEMGNMIDISD